MSSPIATPRLDLVPMDAAFHEASLDGDRARMEALLGARVPSDWPERRYASFWLERLRECPGLQPWLARAVVLRSERRMIGHAGFHSAPGSPELAPVLSGGVELGYTVFAAYRRCGYALEAVIALMAFARAAHPALAGFVASIAPSNAPSLALVRRLAFEKVGERDDPEDGVEHVYVLRLGPEAR